MHAIIYPIFKKTLHLTAPSLTAPNPFAEEPQRGCQCLFHPSLLHTFSLEPISPGLPWALLNPAVSPLTLGGRWFIGCVLSLEALFSHGFLHCCSCLPVGSSPSPSPWALKGFGVHSSSLSVPHPCMILSRPFNLPSYPPQIFPRSLRIKPKIPIEVPRATCHQAPLMSSPNTQSC